MKRIGAITAALAASAMLTGVVLAGGHGGKKDMAAKGPIAERQQAMEDIKKSFMPLVQMVKGQADFDAATVKKNAEAIAAKLEAVAKLFPEGSDKGKTRAKPEIWSNRAEFDKVLNTSVEKAKALAGVTAADQLAPAVMALGGTCKTCHEKFRKPKEEM